MPAPRGLVRRTDKEIPAEWNTTCFELTRAGELMVGLLSEAGFKAKEFPETPPEPEYEPLVKLREEDES